MQFARILTSPRIWLLAAVLVASVQSRAAEFVDPLDAPAKQSTLAPQRALLAVARAGKRLVAVGVRGHIVVSDDGARWTQARVPVSVDLTAVHFVDEQRGWAVGHGAVILHSSDAGLTWTKQADGRSLARAVVQDLESKLAQGSQDRRLQDLLAEARRNVEIGPDKPLLGVWFTDARTGYAVGAYNLVFRTTDGGQHWQSWFDRTENPQLLHLTAIGGHGRTVVVVGEKGLVLQLNEAAERFEALDAGYKGSFFAVVVAPGRTTVFGMRGHAYERVDGSAAWTRRDIPAQGGLIGATLLDDGRVAVVSQDGKLLVRGAGGADAFTLVPGVRPSVFTAAAPAPGGGLLVVGLQGASAVPLP